MQTNMYFKFVAGAAALCILYWLAVTSGMQRHSVPQSDEQPLQAANQPDENDDPFYIYDNGDPEDFLEGSQFFGTQDTLGVTRVVAAAIPERTQDFLYIRDQELAREQFLAGAGIVLSSPLRFWNVKIDESGSVDGETRLAVYAAVGRDDLSNNAISPDIDAAVSEIWRLSTLPNAPVLLERTNRWHNGIQTHAESPIPPPTVFPALEFGNPADEDMGESQGELEPPGGLRQR